MANVREISVVVNQTEATPSTELLFYAGPTAVAPTVLAGGADGSWGGSEYEWCYTFTTPLGESRWGAESIHITPTASQHVTVSGVGVTYDIAPNEAYLAVTQINIYRRLTAGPGSWYLITTPLAVVPNAVGVWSFSDLGTTGVLTAADPGTAITFDTDNLFAASYGTAVIGATNPAFCVVDIKNNMAATIATLNAYILRDDTENSQVPSYNLLQIWGLNNATTTWKDKATVDLTTSGAIVIGTTKATGSTTPLIFRYVLTSGKETGPISVPLAIEAII